MEPETPVPWLMFGTIGIVIILAIVLFTRFMSKSRNRHPMQGQPERNIEQIRDDALGEGGPSSMPSDPPLRGTGSPGPDRERL